jgi:P27 family predicted phage terminase small subunit
MKKNAPIGLSSEARKVWLELRDEYNINDSGGLQLIQVYVEAFERARRCRLQIDEDGEIVTDRFDQQKAHPLLVAEKDARNQMLAALKQLNLDVEPLQPTPGRPAGR